MPETLPAPVHPLAAAKPIDWVSVALAFSMPVLIALQPYLSTSPDEHLPPIGSAVIIAAFGSLVTVLNNIKRRRDVANGE